MSGGIFGGGVIFVVAAVLWTAVLVPSWIRRREFRNAERHALRLQRTLRVLAETAEIPEEVRVEATAREALAHEKILRTAQRQREAEHNADLAAARAQQLRAELHAEQMKRKQATMTRAQKLRRPAVRRIRATGALIAVLSILGILIGLGVAIAGQGPAFLLTSAVLFAASSGLLVLIAPGRVAPPAPEVVSVASAPENPVMVDPVPELREPEAPTAAEQARAHAAAQAAARAHSDRARALARARAHTVPTRQNQPESILLHETPSSVTLQPEAAEVREPASENDHTTPNAGADRTETSRFASMGRVGDTSEGMLDLDAVLRSRRRAG